MTFRFRPAICRDGELFELPRPLTVLRLQESWHAEKFKVPLRDGDSLVGHSRNGVDISLQGQIASHAGALKLDEQTMFETMEALRAALHVSPDDGKFRFFLYCDVDTSTYRHFRDCSTLRFECDLSDEKLFSYSAILHADDPTLYDTGPE